MTRLHHIALGARDVEEVARFYQQVFDLPELVRHYDDGDQLRSIWLDLGGPILMVERTDASSDPVVAVGAGPFLLAISISPEQRPRLEARLAAHGAAIEDRTPYTSYARDPEGNRIAISHYPEPIRTPTSEEEEPADEVERTAEISKFDGEKYTLELFEDGTSVQTIERYAEGGVEPSVHDSFESTYCETPVQVVIVATAVNTAISVGTIYENLIFDTDDQELVAEYSGGEVVDREDESVISDDQPELEQTLRDGVHDPERCGTW